MACCYIGCQPVKWLFVHCFVVTLGAWPTVTWLFVHGFVVTLGEWPTVTWLFVHCFVVTTLGVNLLHGFMYIALLFHWVSTCYMAFCTLLCSYIGCQPVK